MRLYLCIVRITMSRPRSSHTSRDTVYSGLPLRKSVHISGALFPFIAVLAGRTLAIKLLVACILLFLVLELSRPRTKNPPIVRALWRGEESKTIAIDPLLYLLSILSLLVLASWVDEGICYASIIVLTLGDGFSTIVGVHGKICLWGSSKTIEGTVAGILAAALVGFYFAGFIAVVGSAIGMIAEAGSSKYDNITVPMAALVSMFIVGVAAGMTL